MNLCSDRSVHLTVTLQSKCGRELIKMSCADILVIVDRNGDDGSDESGEFGRYDKKMC